MSDFETIDNSTLRTPSLNSIRESSGSRVEFDDVKFKMRMTSASQGNQPGMVSFLMRKNIVKTETQAIAFLLILTLVIIGISWFVFRLNTVNQPNLDPNLLTY